MRLTAPVAVLLDRDGTINVKAPEGEYITQPSQLALLPGAGEAIRQLNERDLPVVVVTNQRGVALGRMTDNDVVAIHTRLTDLLAAEGAHLDAIFYCPHDSGVCRCRKPGTLMLEQTRDELGLSNLDDAVMIGDSASDVQAGVNAGAYAVRVGPTERSSAKTATAASLIDAVARLLAGTLEFGR